MNKICSFALRLLVLGVVVSCQNDVETRHPGHSASTANARRACGNTTYSFVYPDNGYTYNGDGCITYLVTENQTRLFKVRLSNTVNYSTSKDLTLTYPNGNSLFQYNIVSVTGGTVNIFNPSPGGNITTQDAVWSVPNMAPNTTYELTLSVTVPTGAGSGENNLYLSLQQPCVSPLDGDCNSDVQLHLVRSY